MPWSETSPGTYSRPLDNTEVFLFGYCNAFQHLDREHWVVNMTMTVDFNQPEDQVIEGLRTAWLKTRYKYPLIAADLVDGKHVYKTPDKQELANWLSHTFVVHKDETAAQFLLRANTAQYSSLHYYPSSNELMMRTHHWQVDGVGAVHLARGFLQLYVDSGPDPTFGGEVKHLPPSHVEAAGLPLEAKDPEKSQRLLETFLHNLPSIGLPIEDAATQGGTRLSITSFEKPQHDAIVAACKKRGISVTVAVQAALVLATEEMKTPFEHAKNFTALGCFTHRQYLPAPYNDTLTWATGNYMLGLPFSLPPADFTTHTAVLDKYFHQPLGIGESDLLNYYNAYTGALAVAMSQPPPPGAPPPTQPQLSSLGVFESRGFQPTYTGKERSVTVQNVVPALDNMATSMMVFVWSFQGKMHLNACHNENNYKPDFVDKYLERIRTILGKELGITL